MSRWLYLRDNQEFGPLTEKAIRDLISRKRLPLNTKVRTFNDLEPEKDTPWQELSETPVFSGAEAEEATVAEGEPTVSPEARSVPMPFTCRLACVLATATLMAEALYIIYRLVNGAPLDPALAVKGSLMESWALICLAAYLLVVMLWQATTCDVPGLYGAEVSNYTPSHAILWLVPGLNLYHALYAMNEIWTFSKDPRAWTRKGVRGNRATQFWWLTLVGAATLSVVEFIVRRNLGKALTDGRMNHWQSILVNMNFARSLLWVLHLVIFIFLILVIYRRQAAALNNPPAK